MAIRADSLDFMNDIRAACAAPKDGVLVVEPRRWNDSDEELGRIRVWAHVGHGESVRPIMSDRRMEFVLKVSAPVCHV